MNEHCMKLIHHLTDADGLNRIVDILESGLQYKGYCVI